MGRRQREPAVRAAGDSGGGGRGWIGWALALAIVVGLGIWIGFNERRLKRAREGGTDGGVVVTPPHPPTSGGEAPAATPMPTEPGMTAPVPERAPKRGEVWGGNFNLYLGNPSRASGGDHDNLLVEHAGYALSYNDSAGGPNWVSWRLRREDTGTTKRVRYFSPDPLLPAGIVRIDHGDYTGSGFDRGHQCPHSDRDVGAESSNETFVMTNILPQAPTLNQKPWAALESYTRGLVADGQTVVFQVAGGVGEGGVGSKGAANRIAGGKVRVPAKCWKVIVAVPAEVASGRPEGVGLERVKVICVMMPNSEAVNLDWRMYVTTIGAIEAETGYSFLATWRPEVAAALRGRK